MPRIKEVPASVLATLVADGAMTSAQAAASLANANAQTAAVSVPAAPAPAPVSVSGKTASFTLSADNFSPASGDFTNGNDVGNAYQNYNIDTLQSMDQADFGAGRDTLNVLFSSTNLKPIALNNLEVLNLTPVNTVSQTYDASTTTGLTNLTVNVPAAGFTVSNLGSLPVISVVGSANSASFSFVNSLLSGASDNASLRLSGNTGGTVTLQPISGTNGFETMTVTTYDGDSTLAGLDDGTSTSWTSLNVLGNKALTISSMPTTVTTVDASAKTAGGVSVPVGGSNSRVLTGGAGNDTFTLTGYTGGTSGATRDQINGGAGFDTLALPSASAVVTALQPLVTNIEQLTITDALGGTVDASYFSGVTKVKLLATGAGHQVTVPTSGATAPTVEAAATNAGTFTVAPKVDSAGPNGVDSLNLVLSGAGNTGIAGAVTLTGFEKVTVTAADAAKTFGSTVALANTVPGQETITILGDQAVTFSGAVTAVIMDGSAMTGALTVSTAPANAITITGGSAADTITGSASGDSINGGAGNDTINAGVGGDSVSGGAGDDTLNGEAGNDTIHGNDGNDTIDGGTGHNTLYGDAGVDTFKFSGLVGGTDYHNIMDFVTGAGGDKLALSAALYGTGVTSGLAVSKVNKVGATDAANKILVDTWANIQTLDASGFTLNNYLIAISSDDGKVHLDNDGNWGAGSNVIGNINSNVALTGLTDTDNLVIIA